MRGIGGTICSYLINEICILRANKFDVRWSNASGLKAYPVYYHDLSKVLHYSNYWPKERSQEQNTQVEGGRSCDPGLLRLRRRSVCWTWSREGHPVNDWIFSFSVPNGLFVWFVSTLAGCPHSWRGGGRPCSGRCCWRSSWWRGWVRAGSDSCSALGPAQVPAQSAQSDSEVRKANMNH